MTGGFTQTIAIKDDVAAREYRKLFYLPAPTAGTILKANNTVSDVDLVTFNGVDAFAKVYVPSTPGGSVTTTVRPSPSNQVAKDWYFIATKTNSVPPAAEASELFLTRDVPAVSTTITVDYRYDANSGHGGTNTTTLAGVGGAF